MALCSFTEDKGLPFKWKQSVKSYNLSKFKEKDQVLRPPPALLSYARQNVAATMESCLCSMSFAMVTLHLLHHGMEHSTQTFKHYLLVLFYTILKFAVRRLNQHFYL